MLMLNVMGRPKQGLNTSWLNRPECFFEGDGADALPSMFLRPRAAATASKPRTINCGSGFSPYVMILFLLAVASLQATLLNSRFLTNEERAIENVLVVAKRYAAELPSVPSAEAAIRAQSQPLASFEDGRWSEAVYTFNSLLAEQPASAMKQSDNGGLHRQLNAWVTKTQKPHEVVGACAPPSLNCWRTSIQ
jgi:hypothetical protein